MHTPTRLSLLALVLIALLPADLALTRWAVRDGLPRSVTRAGVDAANAAARRTLDTGTRWLGQGADVLGTTLVDAACWVADRASGASCRAPRPALRVVPLEVRTRVIVASDDGDCGAMPVVPAEKTPSSTPADS